LIGRHRSQFKSEKKPETRPGKKLYLTGITKFRAPMSTFINDLQVLPQPSKRGIVGGACPGPGRRTSETAEPPRQRVCVQTMLLENSAPGAVSCRGRPTGMLGTWWTEAQRMEVWWTEARRHLRCATTCHRHHPLFLPWAVPTRRYSFRQATPTACACSPRRLLASTWILPRRQAT
jgi:hypothetical protein